MKLRLTLKNFRKGGHLQLVDSFFLHQGCPLIGENTVVILYLFWLLSTTNSLELKTRNG